MSSWHSYPKIYSMGHPGVFELLFDPVIVEEKIDGSQFSFGRFGDELKIRSKGKEMVPDAPEKMFQLAVDTVKNLFNRLELIDGYTYRGEFLQKSKHNCLHYGRVPIGNIIIFDINTDEEAYLSYEDKEKEAARLGLETVPLLFKGKINDLSMLVDLLDLKSILGNSKIEGFVVKNYSRFGRDKKALMGKYVSEVFKEVQKKEWRTDNPTSGDILQQLCDRYRSENRWEKAIQHLRDNGQLTDSPKDIGPLMKEVRSDVGEECELEIKELLFKWAWPGIERACTAGFPEFYKRKLLNKQVFGKEDL